tara:strand:+ start:361 stop:510 length:150 start_codon:yes stop_codon:yes gene_type:complete
MKNKQQQLDGFEWLEELKKDPKDIKDPITKIVAKLLKKDIENSCKVIKK